MEPKRIQRKRTKGWTMPENAVYVGRPTSWGNSFEVGEHGTAQECVAKFLLDVEAWRLEHPEAYQRWIGGLRGKDLVCWCPLDQPCHADVLLKLANEEKILRPAQDDIPVVCSQGYEIEGGGK